MNPISAWPAATDGRYQVYKRNPNKTESFRGAIITAAVNTSEGNPVQTDYERTLRPRSPQDMNWCARPRERPKPTLDICCGTSRSKDTTITIDVPEVAKQKLVM